MGAALFVDVENMGSRKARAAVNSAIRKYAPELKEIVLAHGGVIPSAFRGLSDWVVKRCAKAKNAADKVIQSDMKSLAKDDSIDVIILVTSDHGFAAACKKVLHAGKGLVLIVRRAKRLLRSVVSAAGELLEVVDVEKFASEKPKFSSVFIGRRDGELVEVPFINGMLASDFAVMLKRANVYRRHLTRWLGEFFLVVQDGRVFVSEECFC